IICSPMTSLKTSIKTITYLSDIGCLEIQGASLLIPCPGINLNCNNLISGCVAAARYRVARTHFCQRALQESLMFDSVYIINHLIVKIDQKPL
ncbi:hypothetical protein ACP81J_23370, partial [Escherichia coli]